MHTSRARLGIASLAAAALLAVPGVAVDVSGADDNAPKAKGHGSSGRGSQPVPGGGAKERARRRRQMTKHQPR